MGDESVRGWDVKTGKERFVLHGHPKNFFLWSAAVHPTNEQLVTGGGYGLVIFWDLQKKKAARTIALNSAPSDLAWHPDGVRLFIATAGRLMIVDGKSGKTLNELDSEQHNLQAIAVSPDGKLVAAGGGGTVRGGASSKKNSVIHVWNVKTGRKEVRLVGHTQRVSSIVFKPDGKELLSVSFDNTLRSWQVV
ncbi:MAG: hypothetical protein JNJ77_19255 [Planctomycetia bacterium]|nr:hypothetical protein [Planctomycetia bacterium]